jgi:AraC-like DNA-binding protein
MILFDTIKKYSETFNNKTLHPLINIVDLNKSHEILRTRFTLSFYAIVIKETRCGDLRYGNQYYDYDEGSMVFFGPNQIVASQPEGELHQPYGQALIFHPDLLHGSILGKTIHDYSFFGYQSNEALHLSEKEKEIVINCFDNIALEISQNIDRHSKKLIIANLELLLKYCTRFYDRQFITREHANHGIIERFEALLQTYIFSEKIKDIGLPSVNYFANELHLSANYFGDLIKKETGKSALEYIHLKVLDVAKDRILDPTKTISEVAFDLGFKYPQHFTRLFKQKIGVTPLGYREMN